MRFKSNAPTMKDVAREAGVALGTVSKVFNGIPVGDSYKARVEEAAAKLGYQVNVYARGLRSAETRIVALILPSVNFPFFGELANQISRCLRMRDYRMLLATTDFDPTAEQTCLTMVQQQKVDGIIGLTYNPEIQVDENIPFVSIDRIFNAKTPCVACDNFGGGQLAAAQLNRLGCRNLLFIRTGSTIPSECDKRGPGFENYCQINKIPYTSCYKDDADGMEGIYDFLKEHMPEGRLPYDGIFCSTDHLAYRVRKWLETQGYYAPEDYQLIGFDGTRDFNQESLICSTIVQPVAAMAQTAVDLLLSKDEKQPISPLICLPVTYEAGGTTRE